MTPILYQVNFMLLPSGRRFQSQVLFPLVSLTSIRSRDIALYSTYLAFFLALLIIGIFTFTVLILVVLSDMAFMSIMSSHLIKQLPVKLNVCLMSLIYPLVLIKCTHRNTLTRIRSHKTKTAQCDLNKPQTEPKHDVTFKCS